MWPVIEQSIIGSQQDSEYVCYKIISEKIFKQEVHSEIGDALT